MATHLGDLSFQPSLLLMRTGNPIHRPFQTHDRERWLKVQICNFTCCRIAQKQNRALGAENIKKFRATFWDTNSCDCTGAEAHLRTFFAQKHSFILLFLCVLRAFAEGVSVQELRTQSRNEEAQREVGWQLAGNFCFYVTIRSC